MRHETGGSADARRASPRMRTVAPGSSRRTTARWRPITSGQSPTADTAGRSAPPVSIQPEWLPAAFEPSSRTSRSGASTSIARSIRSTDTARTSVSRAMSAASWVAPVIGVRTRLTPSLAITRMSYPASSRSAANESTRPCDSISMSNSSAPMNATPMVASTPRIGC